MRWLLDSVILIDHFNGIDSATRFIDDESMDIALSPVTRSEVLTGAYETGPAQDTRRTRRR